MANQLTQLHDFKKILADYHVSESGRKILRQTKLLLLASPTSVGRNTIVRELLKTGKYHFIVSDTTRQPRSNNGVMEQNGVEYWFRNEAEVLGDLEQGKFLEAAIIHDQQVSGISLRELEKAKNEGKVAVTDIEIVGVHNIVSTKPDTLAVFVLPPSFEEWQRRLYGRGDMDLSEHIRRMKSAEQEFTAALSYDYYRFIINDTVDHAVEQVEAVVEGYPSKVDQQSGRELTEQLLAETEAWLAANEHITL